MGRTRTRPTTRRSSVECRVPRTASSPLASTLRAFSVGLALGSPWLSSCWTAPPIRWASISPRLIPRDFGQSSVKTWPGWRRERAKGMAKPTACIFPWRASSPPETGDGLPCTRGTRCVVLSSAKSTVGRGPSTSPSRRIEPRRVRIRSPRIPRIPTNRTTPHPSWSLFGPTARFDRCRVRASLGVENLLPGSKLNGGSAKLPGGTARSSTSPASESSGSGGPEPWRSSSSPSPRTWKNPSDRSRTPSSATSSGALWAT
mmetsp:Transcript_29309/g.63565  ORF Transcript_29309/g.63565 Transcript_29309/m.63565 type:complete len:259 (+) Transcript_29309:985-1761(+)